LRRRIADPPQQPTATYPNGQKICAEIKLKISEAKTKEAFNFYSVAN